MKDPLLIEFEEIPDHEVRNFMLIILGLSCVIFLMLEVRDRFVDHLVNREVFKTCTFTHKISQTTWSQSKKTLDLQVFDKDTGIWRTTHQDLSREIALDLCAQIAAK